MAHSHPAGRFIWYELMTSDATAAARFYGAVVGWQVAAQADPQAGGMDYRLIARDDGGSAGGVLQLAADSLANGAHPAWVAYLQVADVDLAVQAITADGGQALMPKMTLPVGEIAMVTDPMGAPFYLMKPVPPPGKPDAVSDVFSMDRPQHIRWNELCSPDVARARDFYARHFGFQFNDSMPMGPQLGDYLFIDHGGLRVGGLMRQPDAAGPGGWTFYFGVRSASAAKRAIEAQGGAVMMDLRQVPGGDWVLVAADPQGVRFGVVGPRGE
jgi:predicted enzyme related to lactoylglutathione lyase